VDGCADLDTDGVADCKTTLTTNSAFSEDVSGWHALGDTELAWEEKNAFEDLPAGSALVKSASAQASAEQCVALEGSNLLVIAYASAFVDDNTELGQAQLLVSFFESANCAGESWAYFETPPSTVSNSWTTIHAGAVPRLAIGSVSLALVGVKPAGSSEIRVYFDNIMLKTKQLM
jgi:hypothetical protein